MPKTIIFIDIDGVLHPDGTARLEPVGDELRVVGEGLFRWAPLLWDAIAAHDVGLVIHSTWRFNHTVDELKAYFPEASRSRIIGVTGRGGRHDSIIEYADQHAIARYLVLDDMPHEFPPGWPCLVSCDGAIGISDRKVLAAVIAFVTSIS